MRYYRVIWNDENGAEKLSAPIEKWTDAELYRREIGGNAKLLQY